MTRKIKDVFFILIIWFNISAMSIYDITFEDIKTGKPLKMSEFKGKVIMIVNTASLCGFTKQYADMEKLWQEYKDKNFVLIAVPTNDFASQDPGTNKEILTFCETKFDTSFRIVNKVTSKGDDKHEFFKLVNSDFSDFAGPMWNFYKYLYGPDGKPIEWYSSLTKPNSEKIIKIIEKHIR